MKYATKKEGMDRFETLMLAAQTSTAPKSWQESLIRVADTAFVCRAWLSEYMNEFTTADLLEMTRMVMESETELENETLRLNSAE